MTKKLTKNKFKNKSNNDNKCLPNDDVPIVISCILR